MAESVHKSGIPRLFRVPALAWFILVLAFFSARHPVRSAGLWLDHVGGMGCGLILILAALVLGRRILVLLKTVPDRVGERLLVSLGLGFFVLTYGVLAIGLAGGLYRAVGWLVVVVSIVLGYRDLRATLDDIGGLFHGRDTIGTTSAALALVLAPVVTATLWLALAPASAHDALVYHLNLPRHYADIHRIAPLPLNVYGNMPHNLEVLTTLSYILGGEPAARMMDFVMRLAVSAGVFVLARRFVPASGSLLAVLLFLLNPITTTARTAGNIDMGMALFFLLAVVCVFEANDAHNRRFLMPASLLAGYLMGCKYTGIFPALSILAFMILLLRPRPLKRWALVVGLMGLPVVPWLVKNLLVTGNPFYPLFASVFESREWSAALGARLVHWQRSMGMGRGFGDYLLIPWNAAVEGQMGRNYRFFDGVISPLPLAVVPLLALMRNRRTWLTLLGLCVIPFIGWAVTSQQLRFLVPLLPLTSVATAGILWSFDREALGSAKPVVRNIGVACALALLAIFQVPSLARNTGAVLPVVTGEVSADEYLTDSVHSYAAMRRANETLPADARVLMIWENEGYYLERPYLADSFFEASQIAELAAAAGTPEAFAARMHSAGVSHVVYNHELGRYFDRFYGPEYAAFLAEFVANHLELLYSERDVALYRLK